MTANSRPTQGAKGYPVDAVDDLSRGMELQSYSHKELDPASIPVTLRRITGPKRNAPWTTPLFQPTKARAEVLAQKPRR